MPADPARYRQSLLDACDEDDFEEVALRVIRGEYPEAHRTRRGEDGGMDVVSDLGSPPGRAWQCKNHAKIDWAECRSSLRTAMESKAPPPHYTFVFPKPLTGRQQRFWRDKFLPEEKAKFPQLTQLDFVDDLAQILERFPEEINRLNEGVLSSSYARISTTTRETGVNPLASAVDLIGDAPALADRAVEIGRSDPRYRYEKRQREAHNEDLSIPSNTLRVGFKSSASSPREFTVTMREGSAVQENAATPRSGVELQQVSVVFSNSPEGMAERDKVRLSLASGQPIRVKGGDHVGVKADPLPDRFVDFTGPDGLLREGEIEVGLSEPLKLTLGGAEMIGVFPLYRVPSLEGFQESYAGHFSGISFFLDLDKSKSLSDGDTTHPWVEAAIEFRLDVDSIPADQAGRALSAFELIKKTETLNLKCEGLFSEEIGVDISENSFDQAPSLGPEALLVMAALSELNQLDGRDRCLPRIGSAKDVLIADFLLKLFASDEVRMPLSTPQVFGLPELPSEEWDPSDLSGFTLPYSDLAGYPTALIQILFEGDTDIELKVNDDVATLVVKALEPGEAEIVVRLVGPIPDLPTEE